MPLPHSSGGAKAPTNSNSRHSSMQSSGPLFTAELDRFIHPVLQALNKCNFSNSEDMERILELNLPSIPAKDSSDSFKSAHEYEQHFLPLLVHETLASIISDWQTNGPTKLLALRGRVSKAVDPGAQAKRDAANKAFSPSINQQPLAGLHGTSKVSSPFGPTAKQTMVPLASRTQTSDSAHTSLAVLDILLSSTKLKDDERFEVHDVVQILPTTTNASSSKAAAPFRYGVVRKVSQSTICIQLLHEMANVHFRMLMSKHSGEGCPCIIKSIANIGIMSRQFTALTRLSKAPLMKCLLNPKELNDKRIVWGNSVEKVLGQSFIDQVKMRLNHPQLDAFFKCCSEERSRISLIHGPPGTGKSTTLMGVMNGLVMARRQIVMDNCLRKAKLEFGMVMSESESQQQSILNETNSHTRRLAHILVCAPSNTAVDLLVHKVMNDGMYGSQGENFKPRILRIGRAERLMPSLKESGVFLDSVVEKELSMSVQEIKTEIESLKANVKKLDYMTERAKVEVNAMLKSFFSTSGSKGQFKSHSSQQQHLLQSAASAIVKLSDKKQRHAMKMKNFQAILKSRSDATLSKTTTGAQAVLRRSLELSHINQAEIVFCTLGTAGRPDLLVHAKSWDSVIIDEAGQCIETECLIPLTFQTSCAMLFGDPNQLPATVLSRTDRLKRSMMERMMRLRDSKSQSLLSIQYRMHPVLGQVVSDMFYQGKLLSNTHDRGLEMWQPDSWARPFMIADISDSSMVSGKNLTKSFSNDVEAECLISWAARLLRAHPCLKASSGSNASIFESQPRIVFLSPYSRQVQLLQRLIRQSEDLSQAGIMAHTVDSYQGKESDIIGFSAVRSSSQGIGFLKDIQRLNVAMSRARHCLLIVCDAKTVINNKVWQMAIEKAKAVGGFIRISSQAFKKASRSPWPFEIDFDAPQDMRSYLHSIVPSLEANDLLMNLCERDLYVKLPQEIRLPPNSSNIVLDLLVSLTLSIQSKRQTSGHLGEILKTADASPRTTYAGPLRQNFLTHHGPMRPSSATSYRPQQVEDQRFPAADPLSHRRQLHAIYDTALASSSSVQATAMRMQDRRHFQEHRDWGNVQQQTHHPISYGHGSVNRGHRLDAHHFTQPTIHRDQLSSEIEHRHHQRQGYERSNRDPRTLPIWKDGSSAFAGHKRPRNIDEGFR